MFEFHYETMTDFYGEKADIFCRECDADMYDLEKMEIRVEIPDFENPGTVKEIFGCYGKVTDRLYKSGFRW